MKAPHVTEAELQDTILDATKRFGWYRAHFRPALTKHGWRTPVAGDGQGFPDLILLRGPRLVVAELKQKGKKPTAAQKEWLDRWKAVPCAEVYVWRPDDLDDALEILTGVRPQ